MDEGRDPMTQERPSVMAAPNQSEVRARILRAESSSQFPGKWDLEIELLEVRPLSGPDLLTARIGQQLSGFTFEALPDDATGSEIVAKAEYLGDSRRGLIQLSEVRR